VHRIDGAICRFAKYCGTRLAVLAQVVLEDKLLKELSSSQGNILDNEELIATLDKTKGEAEDIKVGGVCLLASCGLCNFNLNMYQARST
jgi:ATP-binding dynein motor region